MDEHMVMDGRKDGDNWMDGWMVMDGWMNEWMDE
jgi:hypothetical protein